MPVSWLFVVLLAVVQDPAVEAEVSTHLPARLELREDGPQRYRFTCDYLVTNADDELTGKQRIAATYVRNLEGGKVRWEDATLASAKGLDDDFGEGEPLDYLDGFGYDSSAGWAMFLPGFFTDFPGGTRSAYAKNLVWDTAMLEQFARGYWDRLELGVPLAPAKLKDSTVPLAGMGAFKNRDIELTWLGTAPQHGDPCALIRYEAFFNRFQIDGAQPMDGLSHYWGLIWVSLADKQLERATLDELVSIRHHLEDGSVRRDSVLRRGVLEKVGPR